MLDSLNFYPNIKPVYKNRVCPKCNKSLYEVLESGRLGCSNCYSIFYDILEDKIKKVQFSDRHVGKIPKNTGKEIEDLINLEDRLKRAIEKEDYLEAAKLRDLVKKVSRGDKNE